MLRSVAVVMALLLGGLAEAQDGAPPVQPRGGGGGGPGAMGGEGGGAEGGAATRVPELLARTPPVVRASELLGTEILDEALKPIARLDDLAVAADGHLVAILARPDGRLLGLPLQELIARAKPGPAGSERATISNFKLARESRSLAAAPTIEDKSKLDEAWVTKLDAGGPGGASAREANETPDEPATPNAPADAPQPLPLVSALLGRPVLDRSGQPLGTLKDLVVGLPKSHVAYFLILHHEGAPGVDGADSVHAVAFTTRVSGDSEAGVRLSLDSQELLLCPRVEGLLRLPADPFATGEPASPLR